MSYLARPNFDEFFVEPEQEILLTLQNITDPYWDDYCWVKLRGETIIQNGRSIKDDVIITRQDGARTSAQLGFRCKNGYLDAGPAYVEAGIENDIYLYDQRFFVGYPGVDYIQGKPNADNIQWHAQGWCYTNQGTSHTPWGSVDLPVDDFDSNCTKIKDLKEASAYYLCDLQKGILFKHGQNDTETFDLEPVTKNIDDSAISVDRSGRWVVGHSDEISGVRTHWMDKDKWWGFWGDQVTSSEGLLHVHHGDQVSHMPARRRTITSVDHELTEWITNDHFQGGQTKWGDKICVWWRPDVMVARHDYSYHTGESEDMKWSSDLLGEDIKTVDIVDPSHVLVNDHIYLNTRVPNINHV